MSIVVFVSNTKGKINKAGLEAICYAADIAKNSGDSVTAVTAGSLEGDGGAGAYGASKLISCASVNHSDSVQVTNMVSAVISDEGASMIITSHDNDGKQVAPRLAARLNCGMVTGVTGLPDTSAGFTVKKNVFSGKAIAQVSITSDKKILALLPNSHGLHEHGVTAEVSEWSGDAGAASVTVKEVKVEESNVVPLPEAELVVSAGRGMKGPENWGMIEELASELGATTACSRPVSDIGWRPHHEHVGQTGVAIRPNLYIAIGISGAIQHLAGVNGSKKIVVVNTDSEAPFFKAADYGIVGDAFEVVPKLIAAAKAFNASK
ncbi:MAG TPA: electron transfer flavoprotein subunit alpha [Flavobacteriales bacterium]|nr:electron transfer flavoprotein subunit alpha [Flavobacteriales bacterium]|tara:strand:- start:18551 stop:19510 length:960 start_codon:yes stop_codon:yes gene_type:complete